MYTAQDREFSMSVNDIAKLNFAKQYIHAGDRVIPTNFDKDQIYMPIQNSTRWNIDNSNYFIINLDHP